LRVSEIIAADNRTGVSAPWAELRFEPHWVHLAASLVRRLPAGRYRIAHWLGTGATQPFLARAPASLGKFLFVCHLGDIIAREVCFTGVYEPQETNLQRHLLAPGMTFVDVGANWGYFSLFAAGLLGPTGRIASLEPDPRLHALLQANLRHNRITNVTPLPFAAADRNGTLSLAAFDESQGNWGLSRLTDQPAAATLAIPTVRIDELLDDLGIDQVDLLKMDIEGSEDLALTGMAAGLARNRYRFVLLEVHPALLAERGRTFEEAVEPLRAAGYASWRIDHSASATRRAAYGRGHLADLIQAMSVGERLDPWPHLLWVSPEANLRVS
jgi:FkbM family methyltransferase